MRKEMMLGVALSALLMSGALAQVPNTNSTPPPTAQKSNAPVATQNAQDVDKPHFVKAQKPDQFLASKFSGTNVLGANNKKIGDVSDILFDKNGKAEAYVISVGGFLGMGAKHVALAPNSFDLVPGRNGNPPVLKLAMSRKDLKEARNFTPYTPPRPRVATTGSGSVGETTTGLGPHRTNSGLH